jgi:hypothetical protein
MNTYSYEHIYAYHICISTSERLSRLDFEIHEIGYQEHFIIDGDIVSH